MPRAPRSGSVRLAKVVATSLVVLAAFATAAGGATGGGQRSRFLQKLDSHLQAVALAPRGDVAVDVYVTGGLATAERDLRALGMHVTAVSDRAPQRMVEGTLPSDALAQASALAATHAILSTIPPVTTSGSVQSEGDAAVDGPAARALGATGAGVQVGIISDSIADVGSGIAGSQASGDLPATVDDLLDAPNATDEGRAMAEIVYDEAPGITHMSFSSGTVGGPAAKARSIDDLVANGATVIADDVSYPGEPFFQDDVIAQAVDRAKAAGVVYVSSAGNEADDSWEGAFTPTTGSTEDFDPGPGVETVQTVGTVPANGSATLVLQWDEPWGHATTDLALDVYTIVSGTPQFAFTVDTNNIATGIPEEFAVLQPGSGGSATYGIAIRRVAGTRAPFMKYIDFTDGAGTVSIDHATDSGAISPDAASASGALTVAATAYPTPTTPEPYSSRGPVTHLFDANGNRLATPDVRQKPDLAGPDGVSTSVSGFSSFYGTSAAAPAVAGIAALMRSVDPTMPVDEVYAILTNPANALPCATADPTADCGVGLALADRAVAQALDTTPPAISATITPASPDGANGWYLEPVGVTWNVTDGESPVVDPAGCDPATLVDTSTTLTCTATSAGGTTSVPVAVNVDTTPPSAPGFVGISAQTYTTATLPAEIGCAASDPTSGVVSCTITGYDGGLGDHTLIAVATDGAGLTSTATLAYTVATAPPTPDPTPSSSARPTAISGLRLAQGVTLQDVVRSGVPVTVQVAAPSTRLVVTIVARVPRTLGPGTHQVTLARANAYADAGTRHMRIRLRTTAKGELRRLAKATLRTTVSASAPGARTVRLQLAAIVRR